MEVKKVHLVSFDVPFPANYGGVIDVYHKIRCLSEQGYQIILHCFAYGRPPSATLNALCEQVYYYPRKTGILSHFSWVPYVVFSRRNKDLIHRLLADPHPVILEGLHSTYYLKKIKASGKICLFRESNIEHHYYFSLGHQEKNIIKKAFFYLEAFKLKWYESNVQLADAILAVSEEDTRYFQHKFPATPGIFLPSFHPFSTVMTVPGKGNYILFHGNLSVNENIQALYFYLREVFPFLKGKKIVAGLNPSAQLIQDCEKAGAEVISNPEETQMQALIRDAHIHCLYTYQATGLKLKLLNSLYAGRHVILNDKMLHGTNLHSLCLVAESPIEFIELIQKTMERPFDEDEIQIRKNHLEGGLFANSKKTDLLIDLISKKK